MRTDLPRFFLLSLFIAACQVSAQPQPEKEKTKPTPPQDESAPSLLHPPTQEELSRYLWLQKETPIRNLEDVFSPPEGYTRIPLKENSFGAWLRRLPLRAPKTEVRSHEGALIREADDPYIAAVAELNIGTKDLQQCADSIIRLHAEWLWSQGRADEAAYNFTSGDLASWKEYSAGQRASVSGKKVSWAKTAKQNSSYQNYQSYLKLVFTYAGTISLEVHEEKISKEDLLPGDFFVTGGSPGHTVIVLDVAQNSKGERVALIGQGFMPAQDFQVLSPGEGGPWFSLEKESIETPFWKPFPWKSLRRF